MAEVNTLVAELKANKLYVLIPTTYKPGMEGKFVLTVSINKDFLISELKEPVFSKSHITNGRFETIHKTI